MAINRQLAWWLLFGVVLAPLSAIAQGPQADAEDEDEGALHAIVLLLDKPRAIDEAGLQKVVAKALGVTFKEGDDKAADWLLGVKPNFIAQVNGRRFLINVVDEPYVEDKQAVAEQLAPDLGNAVLKHKAWLSVDVLGDLDEMTAEQAGAYYDDLGKIASELLGKDTLALYATYTGAMLAYDPESDTAELLKKVHPLLVIGGQAEHPPVVYVPDDDPRMLKAVATAKARWPEFVKAFADRRPDDSFVVKLGFEVKPDAEAEQDQDAGKEMEFMWVQVTAVTATTITGTLDNDPVHVKTLKHGDTVTMPVESLNDWLIIRDGEWTGGFTIEVLKQAQAEQDAAAQDGEPAEPKRRKKQ